MKKGQKETPNPLREIEPVFASRSGRPTYARASHWLRVAYTAAASSAEPRTHVGAVLVRETPCGDGILLGVGVNHRDPDNPDRIIHAEESAVRFAPANPAPGLTLYAPWAACVSCAAAIVKAGVDCVVVHQPAISRTPMRWADEVRDGLAHLLLSGVSVISHTDTIGGCTNRIDGRVWHP